MSTKYRYVYRKLSLLVAGALSVTSCTADLKPTPMSLPPSTPTPTPLPSETPTPAPVIDTITGSFRNQIDNLEANMPRAKSESYIIPTNGEQSDFVELVTMLGGDNLARATQLAEQNDYTLNYYIDRGDDRAVSYLLRAKNTIQKGWGLYAFRVDSTSNVVIEAPHPLYDKRTPSVALDIYRALDARALLIAGAHRNANRDGSADVAHAPESIFQSVHMALWQELQSGRAIILQIHGFHTSKHDGYPQVILGFGEKVQPAEVALARRIKDALSQQGISAGLCTGDDLQELCAKTNVQGSAMNQVIFIHMELDERLRRKDDALITALIRAFAD